MRLLAPESPSGFRYRADFISAAGEAGLVAAMGSVTFVDFELRGVVARRRVAFFGESYDRGAAASFRRSFFHYEPESPNGPRWNRYSITFRTLRGGSP